MIYVYIYYLNILTNIHSILCLLKTLKEHVLIKLLTCHNSKCKVGRFILSQKGIQKKLNDEYFFDFRLNDCIVVVNRSKEHCLNGYYMVFNNIHNMEEWRQRIL